MCLLTRKGVPKTKARYIAEVAVKTEALGVSTHGVVMFTYFDSAVGSSIDPGADPVVVKEKGATALIDGNNAFGQLAMKLAGEMGMSKAKEYGIAMVGVRNTFWVGSLGIYLLPLAEEGFFAQLWAQTSTCKDCAPFGGIDAKFSTNPVALTFPTSENPMLADFSTAAMSLGKVKQLARQSKKAEEPLFLDKEGNLTDDPNAMLDGGSILFVGGNKLGHKGYALSLWCEALTAMAGGNCNNPQAESRQCFNLTVIDPEAFADRDYYAREMKRFIKHVKDSRLRPGFKAIRIPGENGFRKLAEARQKGIPIEDDMVEKLNEIAEKNAIPGIV